MLEPVKSEDPLHGQKNDAPASQLQGPIPLCSPAQRIRSNPDSIITFKDSKGNSGYAARANQGVAISIFRKRPGVNDDTGDFPISRQAGKPRPSGIRANSQWQPAAAGSAADMRRGKQTGNVLLCGERRAWPGMRRKGPRPCRNKKQASDRLVPARRARASRCSPAIPDTARHGAAPFTGISCRAMDRGAAQRPSSSASALA